MSKEKVFVLFAKASENEQLKRQLQAISSFSELVDLGKHEGLEFSANDVKDALTEVTTRPGFLANIIRAAIELFGPNRDNSPPEIGFQPFAGEVNLERE